MQLVIRRGDRSMACPLDELEERVATLLAQDVSDDRTECTDIVPQRRVLRRKFDFARCCDGQEASGGVEGRPAATPHPARSTGVGPALPTAIGSPFCSTSVVRRASLKGYAAGQTRSEERR